MAFAFRGSNVDVQSTLAFKDLPDLSLQVDSDGVGLITWMSQLKLEQLISEDRTQEKFLAQGRQVVLTIPRLVNYKPPRSQDLGILEVAAPHIVASGKNLQ
eukprot:4315572-Amphidinium_carterae.1